MSFLESPRFPDNIGANSAGGPQFNTEVVILRSGFEQRNARWTYPLYAYDVASGIKNESDLATVIKFFNSVRGRFIGFRYKDWTDYTSSPLGSPISATDQLIGTGDGSITDFQLIKNYITGSVTQTRIINKPVPGTTIVAIAGVTDNNFIIDTINGVITFAADNPLTIANITQASVAKVTTNENHNLVVGNTIYFSNVSGMTQINNIRAQVSSIISSTEFEVLINTALFNAYDSDGEIHTIPQAGEVVTAGFEFDVPCRFDADKLSIGLQHHTVGSYSIPIVEMRLTNTPGGGAYITYAVDFDFQPPNYNTTFLSRNQNLISVINGTQGIFSGWFRFDGFGFSQNILLDNQGTTGFCTIFRTYNNTIRVELRDAGNTTLFGFETNNSYNDTSGWHHILCAWDTNFPAGNKIAHLYIDDVSDITITDDNNDAFQISYVSNNWFIGSDLFQSTIFIGCMTEFYFAPNHYLDLSITSNRRKFRNAFGKPILLGSDGSYPTGITPAIYLKNLLLSFATNLGSGGDFTVNGVLASCSSSPTD